jgi:hypothetical protein
LPQLTLTLLLAPLRRLFFFLSFLACLWLSFV